MSDAVSFVIPAQIAAAIQPLGASLSPPQTPASPPSDHINLSAPSYVNPAISFDPVTDIVFFTFRNPDTGKVTEQIPPQAVVSRYRAVEETGIPNPTLPVRPTPVIATPPAPANTPPAPAPTTSSAPPASPGTLA
jgi:hypothetical protein